MHSSVRACVWLRARLACQSQSPQPLACPHDTNARCSCNDGRQCSTMLLASLACWPPILFQPHPAACATRPSHQHQQPQHHHQPHASTGRQGAAAGAGAATAGGGAGARWQGPRRPRPADNLVRAWQAATGPWACHCVAAMVACVCARRALRTHVVACCRAHCLRSPCCARRQYGAHWCWRVLHGAGHCAAPCVRTASSVPLRLARAASAAAAWPVCAQHAAHCALLQWHARRADQGPRASDVLPRRCLPDARAPRGGLLRIQLVRV